MPMMRESGTVPYDNNIYYEESTVTVLGNSGNLVRTGYLLNYWNTEEDGSGEAYAGGAEFEMGSADVELYAQWIAIYTVTYHTDNSESGSVPVDSNIYFEESTVTVLGNTGDLVRTGYVFEGWNTSEDGGGNNYTEGTEFTMGTSDVDLYAQWSNTGIITIANSDSPTFAIPPESLILQSGGGTTEQTISVSSGDGISISSYIWIINGTSRGSESSITLDTETESDWFEFGSKYTDFNCGN